jgi:hypothetical protein
MATGDPDVSMLSRLLRSRLAAGLNPLTGKRRKASAATPPTPDERSSAVIGSLLKDARDAYGARAATQPAASDAATPTPAAAVPASAPPSAAGPAPGQDADPAPAAPCAGHIQSQADTRAQMNDAAVDPGDLSGFTLEILNALDWEDWVTARCDFPQSGPFVVAGTEAPCQNAPISSRSSSSARDRSSSVRPASSTIPAPRPQGAEGRGLPHHPGQLQPGHDHDRSGPRRRHLYRADHAGSGGQDHRAPNAPTRCCRPWAARPRSTPRCHSSKWAF